MFTDQVPDNDMSRDLASRYGYAIYPTVAQALTLDSGALAVDGVVLIGEHGDYPRNEKGQKLYPRHELYREIVEVFVASGRSVPVFCDKHLSTQWDKAVWMVEQSQRLGFPLLAGFDDTWAYDRGTNGWGGLPPLAPPIQDHVNLACNTRNGKSLYFRASCRASTNPVPGSQGRSTGRRSRALW